MDDFFVVSAREKADWLFEHYNCPIEILRLENNRYIAHHCTRCNAIYIEEECKSLTNEDNYYTLKD